MVPDCVPFVKNHSEEFVLEQLAQDLVIFFSPFLLVQLLASDLLQGFVGGKCIDNLVVARKSVSWQLEGGKALK